MALVMAAPPTDVLAAVGPVLSDVERTRAALLRTAADRAAFEAAHTLTRVCAAALLGADPRSLTVVQRCDTCGAPHGRPVLLEAPDLTVTMSHTRGYVAAAAAWGPVGVDVEVVDRGPLDPGVVELALTRDEAAALARAVDGPAWFHRHWVRKESLVKVGVCTLDDLHVLAVPAVGTAFDDPADHAWRFREWHVQLPGGPTVMGCAVVAAGDDVVLRTGAIAPLSRRPAA